MPLPAPLMTLDRTPDTLSFVHKLLATETLSVQEWEDMFVHLFQAELDASLAAILITLLARDAATEPQSLRNALIGGGRCLRDLMNPVDALVTAVDIVGTGGDRKKTLNVSTAAVFVAAAAGLPVAKHGNKAFTSRCGSSEVLTSVGVNVKASKETIERQLADIGITFLYAPVYHPSVAKVAAVRKALKFPTIFNLLGPLINPASVDYALVGCYDQKLASVMNESLFAINHNCKRAWVVHSALGLDELFPSGDNHICVGERDSTTEEKVKMHVTKITPDDCRAAGLRTDIDLVELRGADAEHNAAQLERLLTDPDHPDVSGFRDTVLLNAAAALSIGNLGQSLPECVSLAKEALSQGHAYTKLTDLRTFAL